MPKFIRVQSDSIINTDQICRVQRVIHSGKCYIAIRMIGDPMSLPFSSAFSYDDPEIAEKEFLTIWNSLK